MSFTEAIAINAYFTQFDNIFFAECMREFNRALAFYSERQKYVSECVSDTILVIKRPHSRISFFLPRATRNPH